MDNLRLDDWGWMLEDGRLMTNILFIGFEDRRWKYFLFDMRIQYGNTFLLNFRIEDGSIFFNFLKNKYKCKFSLHGFP